METRTYDKLQVNIADTGTELGETAAELFASRVKVELETHETIGVILALGAAQADLFAALKARDDIEWNRLDVLHVDVYMGIGDDDPRSGGARMRRHLTDEVKPRNFYAMHGDTVPVEKELERYTEIYNRVQPVICVMGIGVTGHLAFIDPPADFGTASVMVAVPLAPATRQQIADGGIFSSLDEVPEYGLSLSIPALLAPKTVIALAHEPSKADAIQKMLEEPVSIMLPASKMKEHDDAHLFLSQDAAAKLSR